MEQPERIRWQPPWYVRGLSILGVGAIVMAFLQPSEDLPLWLFLANICLAPELLLRARAQRLRRGAQHPASQADDTTQGFASSSDAPSPGRANSSGAGGAAYATGGVMAAGAAAGFTTGGGLEGEGFSSGGGMDDVSSGSTSDSDSGSSSSSA